MTTRILLVRHAAHDLLGSILCGRQNPIGLNQAGLAQAARLGIMLSEEDPQAVFTSPQKRALQTAERLSEACQKTPEIINALDEIDFGDWTGLSFEQLSKDAAWRQWNADRLHHRPPAGESMLDVQTRVACWLQQLNVVHASHTVVAVSHADVIKACCCYTLGLSLDFHARFEIEPASITTLLVGDWGTKLVRLNQL